MSHLYFLDQLANKLQMAANTLLESTTVTTKLVFSVTTQLN